MEKILIAKNVVKYYQVKASNYSEEKKILKAVDGVSLELSKGETLGIVGESGCGKSTLGKTLLRLHNITAGKVIFKDKNIYDLNHKDLTNLRQQMQMIFQDPFSSLNPRRNIFSTLAQPFKIHTKLTKSEINLKIDSLLKRVGLNPGYKNRYPHQFSGGQRQRIGIARAIALNPELVVCDEAVSALDVSIQAQIINLLMDLQEELNLTYIFIAHDLSVVEFISDRIIVMYLGRIVESASKDELINNRLHPYTKALYEASPGIDPKNRKKDNVILGDVPSPINPPSGCYFQTRCKFKTERCEKEYPPLYDVGNNHKVACFLYEKKAIKHES